MHTCDVRACVNPAHLRVGTQLENVQDRDAKGRMVPIHRNGGVVNALKLNQEKADEIRARYAAGGVTQAALAKEYGVVHSMVSRIVLGKIWNR